MGIGALSSITFWLSSSYLFMSRCGYIATNIRSFNHHPPFRTKIPEVEGDLQSSDDLHSCQVGGQYSTRTSMPGGPCG